MVKWFNIPLVQVLTRMQKEHKFQPPDARTIQKVNEHFQGLVDSGYEVPPKWLFKGLTILFCREQDVPGKQADSNRGDDGEQDHCRFELAYNTARFAGAHALMSSTTADTSSSSITHIIVDPAISSVQLSSMRASWAAHSSSVGGKIPHLVSVEWVEESWKWQTLVGEERMDPISSFSAFFSLSLHPLFGPST